MTFSAYEIGCNSFLLFSPDKMHYPLDGRRANISNNFVELRFVLDVG